MMRSLPLYLLSFTFIPLFFFNSLQAQEDDPDLAAIAALLHSQAEDWNRGDIDTFMEAYWRSDSLQFGGADGVTYGWQETLKNYKRRYPDREAMGKLDFKIVNMRKLSPSVATLTGAWRLERKNDEPGGHFLLIWEKIDGEWKIIADHTSARCP